MMEQNEEDQSVTIISRNEEQDEEKQSIIESSNTNSNNIKNRNHRLSSHGMNFYILPSTTTSDNRHSWTTFGTGSIESTNTIENLSINNEIFSKFFFLVFI